MKVQLKISTKHLKIDQANSMIVAVIAIASVVTVFSLVSIKSLISQAAHQHRVVNSKNAAVKQLKVDIDSANTLVTRFKVFNDANPNAIGGAADNKSGGPKDGDNARITLDALPSVYDFPALISSLEEILKNDKIDSPGISGTDSSATSTSDSSDNAQPIGIAISLTGNSNYNGIQALVKDLERSIRPFDITNMQLSGSEATMQASLTINTYYQQPKNLTIGTKEVK